MLCLNLVVTLLWQLGQRYLAINGPGQIQKDYSNDWTFPQLLTEEIFTFQKSIKTVAYDHGIPSNLVINLSLSSRLGNRKLSPYTTNLHWKDQKNTEKYWSNQVKVTEHFEKVIFPYLDQIKENMAYPEEQMLQVIMDMLKGQYNDDLRELCTKNNW